MATPFTVFFSCGMSVRYSEIVKLRSWVLELLSSGSILSVEDTSTPSAQKKRLSKIQQADLLLMIADNHKDLCLDEISIAQRLKKPIVIVLANIEETSIHQSPELAGILCLGVPFRKKVIRHALQFWPAEYEAFLAQGKNEPYCYPQLVLSKL